MLKKIIKSGGNTLSLCSCLAAIGEINSQTTIASFLNAIANFKNNTVCNNYLNDPCVQELLTCFVQGVFDNTIAPSSNYPSGRTCMEGYLDDNTTACYSSNYVSCWWPEP